MGLVVSLCDRQHLRNVHHKFFPSETTLESFFVDSPTSSSVSSQRLHSHMCV